MIKAAARHGESMEAQEGATGGRHKDVPGRLDAPGPGRRASGPEGVRRYAGPPPPLHAGATVVQGLK